MTNDPPPCVVKRSQDIPFTIRLLERDDDRCANTSRCNNKHSQSLPLAPNGTKSGHPAAPAPRAAAGVNENDCDKEYLASLLHASFRTKSDNLAAPARHVIASVDNELDLHRLTSIHGLLWLAGRPMPPRPLHHQLLLSRDILVTERMDMHLVWTTGRIFLKPIPRFLLEPKFWEEYMCCKQDSKCSVDSTAADPQECHHRKRLKRALGFLFSYAALISHESDFRLAEEKHLLPPGVRWSAWRTFVEQLDTEHIYPDIDPRFHYGELRLSRLNKLYRLWQTPLSNYMTHWNQYGSFFQDNFAWLTAATVYIVVVLTAMQVGLATGALGGNKAFQRASYGFTVFSILGPLICTVLILLIFSYFVVNNWFATRIYHHERSKIINPPKEQT
ncbi:hypothetical protein BKA56DRAFT_611817 [Ilyonectria sp. MPI-CAGE-AT-0026]|nr:hypothetical protein BKA56DRAFT_611817 [Ilyonectria sp. MPI-CAGE-AT-0026]